MPFFIRVLLAALLSFALTACSKKVSAPDVPTFLSSYAIVKDSLSAGEQKQFVEAVDKILLANSSEDNPYQAPPSEKQTDVLSKALKVFDGKTAEDIIKFGNMYKNPKPKASKIKPKAAAMAAPKVVSPAAKGPVFPSVDQIALIPNPAPSAQAPYRSYIKMMLTNHFTAPVQSVLLSASLSEAGVPVLSEEVFFTFTTPLTPGATQTVQFVPDLQSNRMATYNPGPRTLLQARVIKIMDPAGNIQTQ